MLLKYIFLGLVQGVTEPLPISSSGHLIIFRDLFQIVIDGLSFEIIVNFASFIAVIIIYRRDIFRLIKNGVLFLIHRTSKARADFHFIVCLFIATIPTGVIGLLLHDYIESKLVGPSIVGVTLLFTGIALWIIRNLKGTKSDQEITLKDAFIIGLAQTVALIPGISRSGATVVAAMLLGMKQETALRFSFLLYIPVSLGVLVFSLPDILHDQTLNVLWIPHALAFITSLLASYFALRWFMNIMKRGNLKYFSFYCFIVGTLILWLL